MFSGESEATAAQYLALADGNVESAISLLFESGGPAEQEASSATNDEEPQVREPILPTQEVLVPSEPVCSFPRASNNVFDRFRDFAVETRKSLIETNRNIMIVGLCNLSDAPFVFFALTFSFCIKCTKHYTKRFVMLHKIFSF